MNETTAVRGLSTRQVRDRVEAGQTNDLPRRTSRPVSEIVRANVLTRFNAIIGTLWVLIMIFGEWQDGLFGGIIVANTLIGVVQELRAKRTLDRLAVIGETRVSVVRDGETRELPQHEIVLGDLIVLRPGDRLAVDGTVDESRSLEIDESLLTGEADPVHKVPGDEVMSGSFVVAGGGAFIATKVGAEAYAARLVEEASRFTLARSELQAGINRFLKYVTWLIIPTATLLIVSQLNGAQSFSEAVVGAVAGVVTMVPESLVLMTSIAFAVGVIRLGRRDCLVQELPAIEGLARVDVLCLDKTGTLTEPGMDLDTIEVLRDDLPVRAALGALAASDPDPNPTMRAIADSLGEAGTAEAADGTADPATYPATHPGMNTSAAWDAIRTVPFSSARKWSGAEFRKPVPTSVAEAGSTTASPTGAPIETTTPVAAECEEAAGGCWVLGAADVLLAEDDPHREKAERLGERGLRVLVLARVSDGAFDDTAWVAGGRPAAGAPGATDGQGAGGVRVEAAALVGLRQRIRPEAQETLRYFADQDVEIKVISGDNPASVGAIARSLGIRHADHPVDARTLPEDLEKMAEVLDRNSVFGRVAPQQKRFMVQALQSRGHTVAMTGDGVNDVLALKDADLGVAMGSGSGATRAVAQVVLLDDSFATLPHVVAEGRRVLGNIERVANLFLTKTVYSIMLAILVGVLDVRFPFLPRHLTLISTLTIGIPAFFLALAPNLERARPGFVLRVLRFAVPAGLACGAATFAGYYLASEHRETAFEQDSSTASLALFFLAIWVLMLIARPYNWWRLGLVVTMASAFLVVLAVPWLREFFALEPDNLRNDLTALAIAAGAAVLLTLALVYDKWMVRQRRR